MQRVIMFSLHRCSLDRDAKLSALEERADALQDGSAQFEKRAGSLKNKFWMENLKSMIMMGVVGLILLGLVYFMVSHEVLGESPRPDQLGISTRGCILIRHKVFLRGISL